MDHCYLKAKNHFISKMNKLPSTITLLLLLIIIINQSCSARNLGNPTPGHHHHKHYRFTFIMKDVLNSNATHPKPATTKVTSQLPFPKPLGFFPPDGGIPLPQSDPSAPVTGLSTQTQTLDVSNFGLFFPAKATLQELELGTLMIIDEDLFQHSVYGSQVLGKSQGIYVASSEDGTSHMVAMTATFANSEFKDGLRFFGVYRNDRGESHIAVIGGSGKYEDANGYATVKALDAGSKTARQEQKANKFLLFNVYLS